MKDIEFQWNDYNARVFLARIELEGMLSANKLREIQGHSPAYGEEAMSKIVTKYGIGLNNIPTYCGH